MISSYESGSSLSDSRGRPVWSRRLIYVEGLPGLCIDHPEDFLNVVGHLTEPFFTLQEGCLGGIEGGVRLLMLLIGYVQEPKEEEEHNTKCGKGDA